MSELRWGWIDPKYLKEEVLAELVSKSREVEPVIEDLPCGPLKDNMLIIDNNLSLRISRIIEHRMKEAIHAG